MVPIPGISLKALYGLHIKPEASQAGLRNSIMTWYLKIINDSAALQLFFVDDFTAGVALPVVSDMPFREPDCLEVMPFSGVLAKPLELACEDSFEGQKWVCLAPEKGNRDFPMCAVRQSSDTVNYCCITCLRLEVCYLHSYPSFFSNLQSTCYLLPQVVHQSFEKQQPSLRTVSPSKD